MADPYTTLLAIERSGQLNPAQRTELQNYRSGAIPMPELTDFNFDFAGEAEKAYGELGVYYDRLLRESEGDLNKVLARMATDYETGVRRRREDLATGQERVQQSVMDNALARGIYQKSAYGPGGYGVADKLKEETEKPLFSAFNRAEEDATTALERSKIDIPEQQKRYVYDLEQQRRRESSDLANTRGQRAYADWSRKNAFNPSMT
jgi:hypothetical protein